MAPDTIPTNQHNPVEHIIHFIILTLQPACIYKVPLPEEYGILDLVIVLPDSYSKAFSHYERIIDIAGIHHSNFRFSLHHAAHLGQKLATGSFFFNSVCIPANQLYNNGNIILPVLNEEQLAPLATKALDRFNTSHQSATSFLQGAKFYKKQLQHSMAAFMLHQCIELSFRGVVMALTGSDVRTHSISTLLTNTWRVAPGMNKLFPTDTNWDKTFLPWLDSIYCDSRYKEGFTIAPEQLAILYKRAQQVHATAKQVCVEILEQVQ